MIRIKDHDQAVSLTAFSQFFFTPSLSSIEEISKMLRASPTIFAATQMAQALLFNGRKYNHYAFCVTYQIDGCRTLFTILIQIGLPSITPLSFLCMETPLVWLYFIFHKTPEQLTQHAGFLPPCIPWRIIEMKDGFLARKSEMIKKIKFTKSGTLRIKQLRPNTLRFRTFEALYNSFSDQPQV